MCGIVGITGDKEVAPILLEGLRRLEYRGYDSAGVAVVDGGLDVVKRAGKIKNLEAALKEHRVIGKCGIAHTRWATHGAPNKTNAHPHRDGTGKLALVHNGIIENYVALKKRLSEEGHEFVTDTDTEVLAHLTSTP